MNPLTPQTTTRLRIALRIGYMIDDSRFKALPSQPIRYRGVILGRINVILMFRFIKSHPFITRHTRLSL